jgi:hypothetical protein
MARTTANQAKFRFENRHETRLREKWEISEVRKALMAIHLRASQRWRARMPVEEPPPATRKARGLARPFWFEIAVCRRNDLCVRVEDRGSEPPVVNVSFEREDEQEGLAARLKYPQDLSRPVEYDLWEIRRDVPLSRILRDVKRQWRELHEERRRR